MILIVINDDEPGTDSNPPSSITKDATGVVIWVYDGDTVEVDVGGRAIDVRLVGINSPDRGECFYDEATDHLIANLKGHEVRLEIIGEDQFDRTLAHVWDGDLLVDLDLVERGLAIATTPGEGDRYGAEFLNGEDRALNSGVGLWGEACGSGPLPDIRVDASSSIYNPSGPDNDVLGEEVVGLVNEGTDPVDISGWTVRDESSRHRYTIPNATVIGPGDRLVIASDDPGWVPGGTAVWNNDGDMVMLLDERGRFVDRWRY